MIYLIRNETEFYSFLDVLDQESTHVKMVQDLRKYALNTWTLPVAILRESFEGKEMFITLEAEVLRKILDDLYNTESNSEESNDSSNSGILHNEVNEETRVSNDEEM